MNTFTIYFTNGTKTTKLAKDSLEAELALTTKEYDTLVVHDVRLGEEAEYIWDAAHKVWEINPIFFPTIKVYGKTYGNLCSETPLNFVDNKSASLPAVSAARMKYLYPIMQAGRTEVGGDTELNVFLNDKALDVIDMWVKLYNDGVVDFVFIPLQYWFMMQGIVNVPTDNPFRVPDMTAGGISIWKKYII